MNLPEDITAAQTAARREGSYDYREVKHWQVWAQMSAEARAAYGKLRLPPELLTLPVSKIRDYAERCGIDF